MINRIQTMLLTNRVLAGNTQQYGFNSQNGIYWRWRHVSVTGEVEPGFRSSRSLDYIENWKPET